MKPEYWICQDKGSVAIWHGPFEIKPKNTLKLLKAPGKDFLQLPIAANPYLLDQIYPKFKIGEPE